MDTLIDLQLEREEKDLATKIAVWAEKKATVLPLLKEVEELGIEPRLDSIYGGLDLPFTGDKAKLTAVLRILRRHGYDSPERPKAGEPSYCTFWRKDVDEDELQYFSIWVSFTSTMCRRVQVGTETVEQPVYEVRCED